MSSSLLPETVTERPLQMCFEEKVVLQTAEPTDHWRNRPVKELSVVRDHVAGLRACVVVAPVGSLQGQEPLAAAAAEDVCRGASRET